MITNIEIYCETMKCLKHVVEATVRLSEKFEHEREPILSKESLSIELKHGHKAAKNYKNNIHNVKYIDNKKQSEYTIKKPFSSNLIQLNRSLKLRYHANKNKAFENNKHSFIFDTNLARWIVKNTRQRFFRHKFFHKEFDFADKLMGTSVSSIFRLNFYDVLLLLNILKHNEAAFKLNQTSETIFEHYLLKTDSFFISKFQYLSRIELDKSFLVSLKIKIPISELEKLYSIRIFDYGAETIRSKTSKSSKKASCFAFVLPNIDAYENGKKQVLNQEEEHHESSSYSNYTQFYDLTQSFSFIAPTQQFSVVEVENESGHQVFSSQSLNENAPTLILTSSEQDLGVCISSSTYSTNSIEAFESSEKSEIAERHFIDFRPVYSDDFLQQNRARARITDNFNNYNMMLTQCGTLIEIKPPAIKRTKTEKEPIIELKINFKENISPATSLNSDLIMNKPILKRKCSSIKVGLSRNQKIRKHLHKNFA